MAVGAVYLASKLGLPIVPLGFGTDHPWRAKSWDSHAIPRPFSRVRGIVGPAITIPTDIDREQLEVCRRRVERLLTDLTLEAEDWAASGAHRRGEVCERPQARILQPGRHISLTPEDPDVVPYLESTKPLDSSGSRISA
jgi:hypothetical protein